jgi:hypothetical protein
MIKNTKRHRFFRLMLAIFAAFWFSGTDAVYGLGQTIPSDLQTKLDKKITLTGDKDQSMCINSFP